MGSPLHLCGAEWRWFSWLRASYWKLLATSAHGSRQHYMFALQELVLILSC